MEGWKNERMEEWVYPPCAHEWMRLRRRNTWDQRCEWPSRTPSSPTIASSRSSSKRTPQWRSSVNSAICLHTASSSWINVAQRGEADVVICCQKLLACAASSGQTQLDDCSVAWMVVEVSNNHQDGKDFLCPVARPNPHAKAHPGFGLSECARTEEWKEGRMQS